MWLDSKNAKTELDKLKHFMNKSYELNMKLKTVEKIEPEHKKELN